ncbi:DUF4435 domain-containing protein [Bacillus cereus]|uniref:DUF4435 domain-containing protein n=1 Tax=Bacillus cereus MC67 TaxID=1053219 RepID=J8FBP4_BACCE|nr:DUF4435 domain-containing protein [Bacillus cereus]EJQ98464.1 hypothetical protein II3_03378 [Bacillus cereus MC67]EOP21024.1 hypothetical protein II1_00075 [Bacillus cereus MC118]
MSKIEMTVEEIIAYLNHSTIPTLLVEGKDDFRIYRWLEEKLEDLELDILPCGGRNSLLEVYEEKHAIRKEDVLFFADLDLWLFSGVPEEYSDVIFTKGYSIENDLYSSADEVLESLIDESKVTAYRKAVDGLSKWCAFEVNEHLNSNPYMLDVSPKGVLDKRTYDLSSSYISRRDYALNNDELYQDIKNNYALKIRGKNLLALWEWFVEDKSLKRDAMFEIIIKHLPENNYVRDFIQKMEQVGIK